MWTLQLVSRSTRADITADWLVRVAAALQLQLQEDVAPDWAIAAWSVTTSPTAGACVLYIEDAPTIPNAAGFHDDSGAGSTPQGYAFAEDDTLDQISVTLSHEAIELVLDQACNRYALAESGVAYAEEHCDAVEDHAYQRGPDGVWVSDYVLPSWYVDGSPAPWDRMRILSGAFARTAGGYLIELRGGKPGTDPPEAAARRRKADPRARTARRLAR